MKNGIVYYNRGMKCLVRLAVSLCSLKNYSTLPVRIVTDNEDGLDLLQGICQKFGAELYKTEFKTQEGAKTALLNKTLMHEKSPFRVSAFLDADTLIRAPFPELFSWAEEHDFVVPQFHDWRTKGKIAKRIKAWKPLYPELIRGALRFGPAINCGVYAWRSRSALMQNWWAFASPGRGLQRIPDETCLQVILHRFAHYVAPCEFNASCKYGDPYRKEARIIHYHGNKHCRMADGHFVNASDLWYKEYFKIADIKVIKEARKYDRMLRKYEPIARRMFAK